MVIVVDFQNNGWFEYNFECSLNTKLFLNSIRWVLQLKFNLNIEDRKRRAPPIKNDNWKPFPLLFFHFLRQDYIISIKQKPLS